MTDMVKAKDYSYTRFSIVKDHLPLPPDLSKPHENLEDYLNTLKDTNIEDEKSRRRYQRMSATRLENQLAAIKSNIKVTPSVKYPKYRAAPTKIEVTDSASVAAQYKTFIQARAEIERKSRQKPKKVVVSEVNEEIARVDICKQSAEGSLVIQQRKGIVVVCSKCSHKFTHYSKDLGKQFFCTCSRCHANIRLKHYQRG